LIAADSSVLVAGVVRGHVHHEACLEALFELQRNGELIAPTVAETYAVLTSASGPYRLDPKLALRYLVQFITETQTVAPPPSAYAEALELLTSLDLPGAAVFDALIGLTAREAALTLVTVDRVAADIYQLCGATVRLLEPTPAARATA
jgi:predicted nucleic acid-binding protein